VQVTVPAGLSLQPTLAETKVVPAGRVSARVKPVLLEGPRFLTAMV